MYYDILNQLDGFTDEEFGKIVKSLIFMIEMARCLILIGRL